MILVFGKARSLRAPNLGCSRAEWVTWVIWHLAKIFCTRRDAWAGELSWWSCQSPVAHSYKVHAKFDADSLLYLLSHFEYDGHTVHMLTQRCVLSPLTSTVNLSLFTHEYSSPLSLAARLSWCCINCSCYIHNGWTFSRETVVFFVTVRLTTFSFEAEQSWPLEVEVRKL